MNRRHVPVVLFALAPCLLASRSRAQGFCFDSVTSTPTSGVRTVDMTLADFDGDHDVDVAVARFTPGAGDEVVFFPNTGSGTFGTPVPIATGVNGDVVAADFDGDGDVDLATNDTGMVQIHVNTGSTPFATLPAINSWMYPLDGLEAADLDADGDVDLFAMGTGSFFTTGHIMRNDGGLVFQDIGFGASPSVRDSFGIGDLDGDGDPDLALCDASSTFVNLTRKMAAPLLYQPWTTLTGASDPEFVDVGDVDGDGDVDVVAANWLGLSVTVWRNLGAGTFSPALSFPLVAPPTGLSLANMDGAGGEEIVVGFPNGIRVYSETTPGNFTQVAASATVVQGSLRIGDLDGDLDPDIVSTSGAGNTFLVVRNCRAAGRVVCAGDGSAAACPCSNPSPPQSGAGCATSSTPGGRLLARGGAALTNDGFALSASQLPVGTSVVFVQGSASVGGGTGVTFGDGLRCVGGSIVRLAVKVAAAGSVDFPAIGDAPVSVAGAVALPAERTYQAWFRDSASFCTTSTFNFSNGLIVAWRP